MSERIRSIVLNMLDDNIDLEEMDFRPESVQENVGSAKDMYGFRGSESKVRAV
jgi:hypothetical protein